jgi:hypothetical protein
VSTSRADKQPGTRHCHRANGLAGPGNDREAQHAEPRDGSGSVVQPRQNHATLKGTADRTAAVPPADDKRHDRIVQGRHAGECVAPDVGVAFSQPPRSQPESDERARGRGHGELEAGRMRGEAGAGTG